MRRRINRRYMLCAVLLCVICMIVLYELVVERGSPLDGCLPGQLGCQNMAPDGHLSATLQQPLNGDRHQRERDDDVERAVDDDESVNLGDGHQNEDDDGKRDVPMTNLIAGKRTSDKAVEEVQLWLKATDAPVVRQKVVTDRSRRGRRISKQQSQQIDNNNNNNDDDDAKDVNSSDTNKKYKTTSRPNRRRSKQDVAISTSHSRSTNHSCCDLLQSDGFVRNCVTAEIIGRVPRGVRLEPFRTFTDQSPESDEVRRQSFQEVFDTRAWGHDWDAQHKGLNASGMGATLYWTQEAVATLHQLISLVKHRHSLSRVRLLDVPCGDMAWMARFLKTRDDVDYTGVDIVDDLIEHHRVAYRDFEAWTFQLRDIVQEPLRPDEQYDIILSRTLFQHLFFPDISRVLARFSASGSRYALMTSWNRHGKNEELLPNDGSNPGRFRRLNLEVLPFALSPPMCLTRDGPPDMFEGWDHFLGLWKLPLQRVRDCDWPKSFTLAGTDKQLFSCVNWSLQTDDL